MGKLFPGMTSKPEKFKVLSLIPCWIWVFVLLPMFMPFLGLGLWEQDEFSVWLEIGYHVANGVAMFLLMRSYLSDEWFMVTTAVPFYLKHIALTVGLMMVTELGLLVALSLFGVDITAFVNGLPVVELTVCHTPLSLVTLEPIFGTITLSVFAPISICVLFYCFGFSPVCYKKPWLAYLCIAVITLIPPVVDILWRGAATLVLSVYLIQLPIHLLACWSYQKTDNVWTPLVSLVITNLLTSVTQILLFG